jgi:hypothetical protein
VSGVGDQRHRIGVEAVDGLNDDESGVEPDADRKGLAEIRRRVAVTGMIMSRMRMRVMVGVLVHSRRLGDASASGQPRIRFRSSNPRHIS